MKIVIDIDENLYTRLFDNGVDNYDDAVDMAKAIRNGTPLPKGHGRLIEVSKELECELWTYTRYTGIDEAPYEDATKALELAPTIIEAESEE
jgi:hypothetical protein